MNELDQVQIRCPYCGEQFDLEVDIGGATEDYEEDCTVCCRPIVLHIARDENGVPSVSATKESD